MQKHGSNTMIALATSIAKDVSARHQSDATVTLYAGIWERVGGDAAAALDDAGSRSTFHVRRAAAKYCIAQELVALVRQFRRAENDGDVQACRQVVVDIARRCTEFGALERRHWDKDSTPRATKRNILKHLPANWPDLLLLQCLEDDKAGLVNYGLEIAFLTVSGSRVGELLMDTFADTNGGQLVIQIQGEKVTEHSGQPSRRIHVDPGSSLAARLLYELAEEHGRVRPRRNLTAGAIREGVRRVGRRCFQRGDITPILFRHRMSALVKAEGWGRVVVACVMGHVSTRTQGRYALAQQAAGGSGLLRVETARQVRAYENRAYAIPTERDPQSARR